MTMTKLAGPPGKAATLAALFALGACSAKTVPVETGGAAATAPAQETIAISVGPCFGFCPVYEASITPGGGVTFNGERHTQVLGERTRAAGQGTYRSLANALAPYRPSDGTTAQVECSAAISDTSAVTITWTSGTGRKTVATHRRGCADGPGKDLDKVLESFPRVLGIADWAKQTTRPGTSRG